MVLSKVIDAPRRLCLLFTIHHVVDFLNVLGVQFDCSAHRRRDPLRSIKVFICLLSTIQGWLQFDQVVNYYSLFKADLIVLFFGSLCSCCRCWSAYYLIWCQHLALVNSLSFLHFSSCILPCWTLRYPWWYRKWVLSGISAICGVLSTILVLS